MVLVACGVLGGQAKGVVAHRVQHVKAAHAGLARHGVADRVVARVAHVQVARGVREHLQHVLLGLLGALLGLVELLGVPLGLPAGLDLLGVVGRDLEVLLGVAHLRDSFLCDGQPAYCSSNSLACRGVPLRSALRETSLRTSPTAEQQTIVRTSDGCAHLRRLCAAYGKRLFSVTSTTCRY